jgi:hypothetical protein
MVIENLEKPVLCEARVVCKATAVSKATVKVRAIAGVAIAGAAIADAVATVQLCDHLPENAHKKLLGIS